MHPRRSSMKSWMMRPALVGRPAHCVHYLASESRSGRAAAPAERAHVQTSRSVGGPARRLAVSMVDLEFELCTCEVWP